MSDAALPRQRTPVRTIAIGLLAVAVLAGGGFAVTHRKEAAGGAAESRPPETVAVAPPQVGVELVTAERLSQAVRVTGTLKTDETVTLSTKATGIVRSVAVKEGDRVRAGQLLVQIDDADLRAQRDRALAAVRGADAQGAEARAAVRVAEAKLQQAKTNRGVKDVAAESTYQQAQQTLAAAKARLDQAQQQAKIAATEAQTRVESARAALASANEQLKTLQEGSRKQEIATAQASVNRAQSQVARMKSQLDRREQLYREKAVAAEVVDNARRDYDVAISDLNAAKEQLSLVQEGPRTQEVRVAEEAVRQAEAALRDAEANRARQQISDKDVEAAQTQVTQAQSGLEAARANLAQKDWNQDEIRSAQAALNQARAGVTQAQASAAQARADVRYQEELIAQTRVYSPVNGVVTSRNVQPGAAVVQTRNELLTVVASDTLYFEATAPETQVSQLRPGLPAQVELDAVPGRTFGGVIREIIPVAEGTNRSVRLRISLPHPPKGLGVVGGFARATIAGRSTGNAISVPRAALVSDEGEMAVFVVDGENRVHRQAVEIANPGAGADRLLVTGGLRGGEMVVVDGASGLTNGQTVTTKRG